MFYTYILKSRKNGKLYIGSTDDLKRRFREHNMGQGGDYTSRNRPFDLIYYEAYAEYADARKSERFFKTGYGREVLNGKLENYITKNK